MGAFTGGLDSGMDVDDAVDQSDGGGESAQALGGGTGQVLQAGMAQAPPTPQQPQPQPTDAPKRHGGLLTGLVGVLLDGLSAGVRTPQGPNGMAQSADMAAKMPQQRQQQQIAMQNQAMMQKTQLAQAHVQQLQARLMASSLDDEVASGLTDAAWKFATNSVEQGTAKMVSGAGTRESAFDKLKELHDSGDPDTQGNLFAFPAGKDKDGNSTWAVYETYPNKTLQEDTKFHLDGDKENGVEDIDKTFPAGTPMQVYTTTTTQLARDHIAKLHTAAMANKAEKPPTGEEAAYQEAVKTNPKLTRLQFHQQWEKASAKPTADEGEKSDYRLLAAQDRENKSIQPIIDKDAQKISDLNEADKMLDDKNAMGDAFAPVKALVGIAGGQGSGVRITTPELNRILTARGWGGSAEVFLTKKVSGASLSDDQRTQLHGILDDVKSVVQKKAAIYKQYASDVNNAPNPQGIRQARANFIKSLDDLEKSGTQTNKPKPPPPGATMKVPSKVDGKLHWSDGTKDMGLAE